MVPQEIGAKYEVRGTLGSGAMGTVYDAFDRLIERRVAIKVVRKPPGDDAEAREAAARFRREAQAAGRLAHPSIVAVYDYGENAEYAWIVMELVEGGSLKDILDRGERLALPHIVGIMDQVLSALAFSHQRGVVHRDIKPANIMLTAEGQVKIADFGIARLENSSMTQVGTLMGTPSYMAPEQFRGEPVDARADIWAAGVVLYQLLTGEKPFDGGFNAVMHKALNTEPPPPSTLSVTAPRAFDAVVARAMAKRPEDRFPTATAFAEAIRAAASAPAAATVAAEAGAGATTAFSGAAAAGQGDPTAGLGEAALPFADADATVVAGSGGRGASSATSGPAGGRREDQRATGGSALPPNPGDTGGGKRPWALIGAGGAAALAAAAAGAWFLVIEPEQRAAREEQARLEREAREAADRVRAEQERLAAEMAAAERARQEEAERQAQAAAAIEATDARAREEQARLAREREAADAEARAAAERERLARDQAERERLARERAAAEEAARAAAERERQAAIAAEQQRLAAIEAERQRLAAAEEAERQRVAAIEAERQRLAAAEEAERQHLAELERQRQAEAERQRLAALEHQRQEELERQRLAAEQERQRQAELERQRQAELERQRPAELERQQQLALLQRPDFRAAAPSVAAAAPCSLLAAAADDNGLTLAGVLRRGGDGVIRRTLAERHIPLERVQLRLQPFDGPYCSALDALRPVLSGPESAPQVSLVGRSPLVKGQLLRFDVTLPDWPSQLHVGYLMNTGEAVHLVPAQPQPAGARIRLGEPRAGFTGWEVDEPFGTDLLLVIASERPLFPANRPQVEPLESYVAALSAALRTAQREGWRVAVRPMVVETAER
ncbi:MAG: protein kinase [Acetobacteraceae bacterium]|nr:protein kinase [Acetobacteraceae bacterium]